MTFCTSPRTVSDASTADSTDRASTGEAMTKVDVTVGHYWARNVTSSTATAASGNCSQETSVDHCTLPVEAALTHGVVRESIAPGDEKAGAQDIDSANTSAESDSDDEDENAQSYCSWHRLIARVARRITAHPVLEGLNVFIIIFFLLVFLAVELGARESQYRPVMLIL